MVRWPVPVSDGTWRARCGSPAPGVAELREEAVAAGPGEVVVETRFSGISRGTEALVLRGGVPEAERARMRAPLQAGSFPFPVKYGYAAVGRVVEGPAELAGRDVFVLHPHQDRFAAPAAMAVPLPEGVPPARAVLGGQHGDGAERRLGRGRRCPATGSPWSAPGVVGALAAWLCARLPGAEVTLVDVNPGRAALAAALGCGFAAPEAAPADCDLVIHASASGAGLATALGGGGARGDGGRGELVRRPAADGRARRRVPQPAAAAGLEPGRAGADRRGGRAGATGGGWRRRSRLLADPALDVLISGETAFDDLPARYAGDP